VVPLTSAYDARVKDHKHESREAKADDFDPSDGVKILGWPEAVAKALDIYQKRQAMAAGKAGDCKLSVALDDVTGRLERPRHSDRHQSSFNGTLGSARRGSGERRIP
jgi:hypothetical protein